MRNRKSATADRGMRRYFLNSGLAREAAHPDLH